MRKLCGIAVIIRQTTAIMTVCLLAGLGVNAAVQRNRGVNQPGAAGNRGGGHDAGFNQPGRAGNNGAVGGSARQTRAVADPGFNQVGAVGNAGGARDPGFNQPGAAGNRR